MDSVSEVLHSLHKPPGWRPIRTKLYQFNCCVQLAGSKVRLSLDFEVD